MLFHHDRDRGGPGLTDSRGIEAGWGGLRGCLIAQRDRVEVRDKAV